MSQQSSKMSLSFSLNIKHVIPSINIFPIDMIYEYGDTIREYDALLLIDISTSNRSVGEIMLMEDVSQDIDNEIAKIVKDIKTWPPPIVWDTNRWMDVFDKGTPLYLKAIQIPDLDKNRALYEKIYKLGYELYNLLFYTIIHNTINVPKFILDGLNNIVEEPVNNIYSEYIECYIKHFKTLLKYRKGETDSKDELNKCVNDLGNKIDTQKLRTIKEKLEDLVKEQEKINVDIYIYPQITYPYPEKIIEIIYPENKREPSRYISIHRIEKQVNIIKQFLDTLKNLRDYIEVKNIYLVASNWEKILGDKYTIYIDSFKKANQNIDIISDKQRKTNYLPIILIIYDYVKHALLEHIEKELIAQKSPFIVIMVPENCYIPKTTDDKGRLVEIHSLGSRESKENIFQDQLYSQHIYFYYYKVR